MKRIVVYALLGMGLALLPSLRAGAQLEIITDIIKQVIMAADLVVQKAQTQTIILQEAQKEAENLMEQTRLADIIDWVQQQKDLYQGYYQELWQVKNALANFQRVAGLIDKQAQLISDYKSALALIGKDAHFSAAEIAHMSKVYSGILNQSMENISKLELVINALVTQMDDGDRLQIIDAATERVDRNASDMRQYTQQNVLLSMQRARDQDDLNAIRALYGIP